jgi:hypothetical protein
MALMPLTRSRRSAFQFQRRNPLASDNMRVFYYFKKRDNEIWMLTIYGKSQVENIPAHILRQIAEEVKDA